MFLKIISYTISILQETIAVVLFTPFDRLRTGFDKLRANGQNSQAEQQPFVLSLSKHEPALAQLNRELVLPSGVCPHFTCQAVLFHFAVISGLKVHPEPLRQIEIA
jgi:hypothetical protein